MEAPFAYKSLNEDREIRLLILEPSQSQSAEIHIRLIPTSLSYHLPYEALSYAWGDPKNRRSVIVEGKVVSITANLESALRHLRSRTEPRCLWVDAICINQENMAERSSQVMHMREIYSRCSRDILWLGKDSYLLQRGIQAMNKLGSVRNIKKSGMEHRRSYSVYLDDLPEMFWKPPVWSRVWVMQELALAPDIIVVAGKRTASWKDIETFLDTDYFISKWGVPDAFHSPSSHGFLGRENMNLSLAWPLIISYQRKISQETETNHTISGSSCLDVLARFRFCNASDARDNVFALLGLISDRLDIRADYELSVKSVYLDASRRIIDNDRNLDLLAQGPWQLGYRRLPAHGLPSWAPDFSSAGSSIILFAQRRIYDASKCQLPDKIEILPDDTLVLEGFFIGSIGVIPWKVAAKPKHVSCLDWRWNLFESSPNPLLQADGSQDGTWLGVGLQEDSDAAKENSSNHSYEEYWRTVLLDCVRVQDNSLRRIQEGDLSKLREIFHQCLAVKDMEPPQDLGVHYQLERNLRKWKFTILDNGVYGMASRDAEPGDQVMILKGSKVPVVLRRSEGAGNRFTWVGSCYIHKHMDGEALKDDAKRWEKIEII